MPRFRKVAGYKTPQAIARHAASLGIGLPLAERSPDVVMGTPWQFDDAAVGAVRVANRFAILPMEGWDAGGDGAPSERVQRRWLRFGESGAKLLWFEATAVRHDGRANPNQLVIDEHTVAPIARLREAALERHAAKFGSAEPPVAGLQLTHSGRWCRPHGRPAPRVVYRHPELDARVGVDDDSAVLSDVELEALIEDYVTAAARAQQAGFDFVDLKHCHGYFGHELLSAYDRPGPFGGSLENRTRFLTRVVEGVRARCPGLAVAVRFSAYDFRPFRPGEDGVGVPQTEGPYAYAFGGADTGLDIDFDEIEAFVSTLVGLGVGLVCVSGGSPYYNPHIMRPAFYPPSDGYQPPEDPVLGVARMLDATRRVKAAFPQLGVVGSGFTYLQEHLPAVAAGAVEDGWMDSAGLGRMSLSYPDLPDDVLTGRTLARKRICRTFSDCTTAPRNGLVSGCYPLDEVYKGSDEYARLKAIKRG